MSPKLFNWFSVSRFKIAAISTPAAINSLNTTKVFIKSNIWRIGILQLLKHRLANPSTPFSVRQWPQHLFHMTISPGGADLKDTTYKPVNEIDQETYDLYDPVLFDGAPVCLQLVGRTMQEEQLLAVTAALDKALRHSGVREATPDEPSEIHCDIA
ncbi:hypothetical protein PV10_08255 [Exophiala mesophila]|uniref:Amidase domain-containing protein n=1 Tax=Exophiala mesophila TaxID=212818 RepID=A0A0D1WID7_EXOME|nr:uncharacterized protein PV10_08255 [Exophiala mesophila]KIV88585.1 hypothetical protein PV10_08255 [Exophiala mesophila]